MEKTLKETTRQQTAVMETAWLEAFPRVLLQDSTQMQLHEKLSAEFKGSGGNASTASIKQAFKLNIKRKYFKVILRNGVIFQLDIYARLL